MTSVGPTQSGDRRRDRGASLVEFALICPLLFAILLGTITGGLALSKKNSLTNAVREGGRVGATLPKGADWSTGWAVDVRTRVVSLAGGDLTNAQVCVQMINASSGAMIGQQLGASCSSVTAPSTPASATGCVVKVWARTSAEMETIFFTQQLTLDGQAVGRYERTGCP